MSLMSTPGLRLLFLAHLMRSPAVIEKARNVVRPADFYYPDERGLQLAWAISLEWYATNRTCIPATYLAEEVTRRLTDDPGFMAPQETVGLLNDLSTIYQLPEENLQPTYILDNLQEFVDGRRVAPALSEAVDGLDPLDARLDSLMRVFTSTRIAQGTVSDIFSEEAKAFEYPPKDPTGVACIDPLLDGGTAIGEVYGLLGVSGMGKSIISMQLAIEKARRRKHVALFHYEMDVRPVVSTRIYAYLADIPKDVLSRYNRVLDFPTAYLEKLRAAEDEFAREYLHVIDMKNNRAAGAGGMADVRAQLRELDMQGKHVEFAVFDQLLPMVKRIMTAGNMKQDTGVQRMLMQKIVDDALVMCRPGDMACSAVVVHQSSSDVKKRPPVVKPKQGESQEDRAFDNWLTYCIALGTQDEERRCWCVTTKARGAARDGFIVQLNGRLPRFDYEPNKFMAERTGFVSRVASTADFTAPASAAIAPEAVTIET